MRVVVLYHQKSEQEGLVQDFARDYRRFKNKKLELLSLESVKGADLAVLYGVTIYPAILAISDDGSLQRLWQGIPLPLMDELDYYTKDQPYISSTSNLHHPKTVQPLTPGNQPDS